MKTAIRLATNRDAASIAAIYAPYCEASSISFEIAPPSPDEFVQRIHSVTAHYPWLVLEDGGVIAGYAYASRHSDRAAYAWAANMAVYIHERYKRRGVGRALYMTLFELLRQQGYFKACAGITLPNAASVGLHEAVGFKLVGVYRGIGFKLGSWHDVAWYEAEVQPEQPNPPVPRPVAEAIDGAGWARASECGLPFYVQQR